MQSNFISRALSALIFAPCCAHAASTVVFGKTVNTAIPDNNGNGLVSTINVSGVGQEFDSVEVAITTQFGWNGDLYAYLEHNGTICVLLNRPGRTLADTAGVSSSGMQIRFADSAADDVHTTMPDLIGALASGTYQPDARAADPDQVTDTSLRSLYLSGFNGQNADGDWTLFVADLSGGDVANLGSWSLTFIPEPSSPLLVMFGSVGALLIRRRRSA